MIDADLIESLDEVDGLLLRDALACIGRVGILGLMEARLLENLASGDLNEPDDVLGKRILRYRQDLHQIRVLQELCETYQQDIEQ